MTAPPVRRGPLATAAVLGIVFLALVAVATLGATPLPGERPVIEKAQEWEGFGDTARILRDEAHDWSPLLLLALGAIALWQGSPGLAATIILLWPARLLNSLAKIVIDRPRPEADLAIDGLPTTNGLPSGHAFAAAALAIALVLLVHRLRGPRAGIVAAVPALAFLAAAGYARLWLGVHWPSDIAGGVLFAGCLAALLLAFERYFEALCEASGRWTSWRNRAGSP